MFHTQSGKVLYGYKAYNAMIAYLEQPEQNKDFESFYFGKCLSNDCTKVPYPVRLFFKIDLSTKTLSVLVVCNGSFKRDIMLNKLTPEINDLLDTGGSLKSFLVDNVSEMEFLANRLLWFPDIEIIGIVSIADSIETELKENIFDLDTDWVLMDDKYTRNPKAVFIKHNENDNLTLRYNVDLPLSSSSDGCIPLNKIADTYKTFLNKIITILNTNSDEILFKLANIYRLSFNDIKPKDYINDETISFCFERNIESKLKILNSFDIESIDDLSILDMSDVQKRYGFLHKNYKELKKKYPMGINVCGFKIKFPSSRRNGSKYIRIDINPLTDGEIDLHDISQLIYFERVLYCCGKLEKYKQTMRELILTLL